MAMDVTSYILSKGFTSDTVDSLGAVKGAPCTIKSQTETDDSYIVTFEWTGTSGTTETSQLIIKKPKDGVDGETPVKGVDYFDGVNGQDGQPGEKGADGSDGIGISSITKISTVGLVDTYRIAFTDNTTFDYSISNGKDGVQGLKGDKGEQGERGVQGIQGIQGEKGADGYPFLIYKEYSDISEFNADDFPEIGLMFMIKTDDIASFPVYRYTGDITTPYSHVTDLTSGESIKGEKGDTGLQGEQGIPGQDGADGITYTPTIGTVTSGTTASASVTVNKDTSTATFNFVIPKGDKGDIGASGTTPYIDGTTKHWMIGGQDTGIIAEGTNGSDGITPHIGSNNNWFIGDVDTGVLARGSDGVDGNDGRSIVSITKDRNENIVVTFSDNTTQTIGKLSVDIQGDFLTEDGFGNLRYYNGHFQYYDTVSSTWIDTSVTPSNVYIMNMTPQEMKSIFGVYDTDLGKYKLKFEEPDDTIIDGQVACVVEKVIIRRKLGSVPTSETDGNLVIEVKRKDFGSYKNEYFIDTALSPSDGEIFYYKAFPMSTTGFYNTNSANETDGIRCKDYNLYGFKLDQNESDPNSMITYLSDCDNKYYESAKMNYTTDTFNYGDWGDAWFIKNLKPCMLKYDGTVDYELDKNDYTKKTDDTASDVENDSYAGNAMVGIPKVYWKIVNNGDNTANIYISDKQVDTDFHCWSHIDNNGAEIDYCYMPIYNGSNVNSVLRSISGKTPMSNKTTTTEITYAKANNTSSDIIWYTELFNDRMLINLLLLLIGKSTNTQVIFGTGNSNSYISESNIGIKNTGTMNTKGLFWGNQDNKSGVKVFGMEHWWGNQSRRIGGWINDKGMQKIKMTYGQSDGSTVDGYNLDGNGYITIANSTPSVTTGGYISKMLIVDNGLIPTTASGSATTYYCDGLWASNSQVNYANVGGNSSFASAAGALCSNVYRPSSFTDLKFGASISCKPLASTN